MNNTIVMDMKTSFMKFNQNHECFIECHSSGFKLHTVHPHYVSISREMSHRPIQGCMLYRTNIVALICADNLNQVKIWDDHQQEFVGHLDFRLRPSSINMRRDAIIVSTDTITFVYRLEDLKLLDAIETYSNPRGITDVSIGSSRPPVLATPGIGRGNIRIDRYTLDKTSSRRTKIINAHTMAISALTLSCNGDLVASSSIRGTIIRVFNTETGNKIHEFRRGSDQAKIYSLAFDAQTRWLAVSSDKGTVHIFSLSKNTTVGSPQNPTSVLSGLGTAVDYFNSSWSYAQFRPPCNPNVPIKVCFSLYGNSLVVVTADGKFYSTTFNSRDPPPPGALPVQSYACLAPP